MSILSPAQIFNGHAALSCWLEFRRSNWEFLLSEPLKKLERESILLRILWMLLFTLAWQFAELLLGGVVLVQLGYRLFYGAPSAALLAFGDSLSQYLAQIGRFGTFNSDEKPWPFADWPVPQAPQGETAHSIPPAAHPVRDEEPKL